MLFYQVSQLYCSASEQQKAKFKTFTIQIISSQVYIVQDKVLKIVHQQPENTFSTKYEKVEMLF